MDDLQQLLTETTEDPPCGPNLEYDTAFFDLEQSAQGKPEQQFGDTLIAAEEPDWAAVRQHAAALLGRSKDLRPAVLLTRALTHDEGVAGFNRGLQLILQLLGRYWAGIHPQLDADDHDDPTMRLNSLAPLVDGEALLRDLRNAWLVRSRAIGQVRVRDVEVALGRLPPPADGTALSMDQIDAMVRDCAVEDMAQIDAVRDAVQTVRAVDSLLAEKVGSDRSIDFRPLATVLAGLQQVCDRVVGSATTVTETAANAEAVAGPARGGAAAPFAGEIRSRDDAIRMLDKVCEYLERCEPTNPAPLLIRRGKRLMTMSFVDIIRDLAPDSVSQVETIAGSHNKE